MRDCAQVAAVCYRFHRGVIEFLLVQTRGCKRWTFPKGGAEPGLTHAQAAAIEAFEEAGVHGRIEEAAFVRYQCRKPKDTRSPARRAAEATVVSAHLCEVLRLCAPKESERNRTWFSVEEAKEQLREGRKKADGQEFARVVHLAVARIKRRQSAKKTIPDQPLSQESQGDEWRRVQFEANGPWGREPLPYARHHEIGRVVLGEVLPFAPSRLLSGAKKVSALGAGDKSS